MPQASHSDMATRSLPHYFTHIVKVKFVLTHSLTLLTEHACHHTSFWGSKCDSNHAPTISLKLVHFHGEEIQGDPLIALLYIIVAEVLGNLIRTNKDIKGITIKEIKQKILQYADYTQFVVTNDESVAEVFRQLKQ